MGSVDEELGDEGTHNCLTDYSRTYIPDKKPIDTLRTIKYQYCQACGVSHIECPLTAVTTAFTDMVSIPLNDPPYVKSSRYAVILLGDAGVGKTALFRQYLQTMKAPLQNEFRYTLTVAGFGKVKLHVEDTADQERFHSITAR